MKKIVFGICSMMLALTFASCNKVEDPSSQKITELRFNIQVEDASSPDTKAVKTAWADGDKVYVFFSGLKAMKYVTLTYNEASGTWDGAISAESELDASDLSASGTMYGVHFPFGNITIAEDTGDENGVTFRDNGEPVYTYYMTGNTAYTVKTAGNIATLTGAFNLSIPDGFVWFFIDKNGDDYCADGKYRLAAEGFIPAACTSYSGGSFTESTLHDGIAVWGYAYGSEGIAFTGKVNSTWASSADHAFLFYPKNGPSMSRKITGALDVTDHKHPSVKLKAPTKTNSWKENAFRGYYISNGLLKREGENSYSLTNPTNPFDEYKTYHVSGQYFNNGYYHKWQTLKDELGSDGNNIKANSGNLPAGGWRFPSKDVWNAIFNGTPNYPPTINKQLMNLTYYEPNFVVAQVTYNSGVYQGVLLIPDGAIIDCENIHEETVGQAGTSFSTNSLTWDDYTALVGRGCTFLLAAGYPLTSSYCMDGGRYWTCTYDTEKSKPTHIRISNGNGFSFDSSQNANSYMTVRLTKPVAD